MTTTESQEPIMNDPETIEADTDAEGSQSEGRPQISTPRIVVNDSIDIDLVREQLENHGREIGRASCRERV